MGGESALLRFEPGLMIWTIIIFAVLLAVLRKIAWKPLLAALDEREQNIKEALEQAQKTQRETELVLAENQRRTDEGFKKAEEIVQQARQEAEQMRQKTSGRESDGPGTAWPRPTVDIAIGAL